MDSGMGVVVDEKPFGCRRCREKRARGWGRFYRKKN